MPDVDPLWLKFALAGLPIGYALGTALVVVLWRLNTSLIKIQLEQASTKIVVKSLVQSHSKKHNGECDELLNWLGPELSPTR